MASSVRRPDCAEPDRVASEQTGNQTGNQSGDYSGDAVLKSIAVDQPAYGCPHTAERFD